MSTVMTFIPANAAGPELTSMPVTGQHRQMGGLPSCLECYGASSLQLPFFSSLIFGEDDVGINTATSQQISHLSVW